ncbi:MAG TPA: hypothetical protein PLI95_31090, partial [Polyangiaceae bacterium]|nr:hypothetical protein [Polyangiaceae bacterium]
HVFPNGIQFLWRYSASGLPFLRASPAGGLQPVLEAFHREHPDRRRVGAGGVGVEALEAEVERIRQVLTGGGALTDIQLFSQLKALGEVKAALASMTDPRARQLEQRVGQLLEASLRTGRFAQI